MEAVDAQWKVYRNLLVVWTLTGFWHGASWTFMAWGFYYGVLICLEKWFLLKWLDKIPRVFRHVYVLLIVMVGWVFFRADDFAYSFEYIQTMFFLNDVPLYDYQTLLFLNDYTIYFALGIIFSMPIYQWYLKWSEQKAEENSGFYISLRLVQTVYYLIIVAIVTMFLVNSTHNPFIYFRF